MPPFKWLVQIATLCRDVYQDTPAAQEMHVMAIQDFRYGHDYGCAYITPGTIYVCIRGSDGWHDWRSNLRIIGRDNWHGMAAHRGFSKAARGMEEVVLDLIDLYAHKRIVFCGHSRGGAIALLLAVAAEQKFPARVIQCVTLGQPRVSTEKSIRARFSGEYIRVQNGSDLVCRWPKVGFSHAGTCLYLTNRGQKQWVIDPSWLTRAFDRVMTLTQRASDHNLSDYIKELLQCAKPS
jgi:pimeloyl-ACP methyl ester carboxylesterase